MLARVPPMLRDAGGRFRILKGATEKLHSPQLVERSQVYFWAEGCSPTCETHSDFASPSLHHVLDALSWRLHQAVHELVFARVSDLYLIVLLRLRWFVWIGWRICAKELRLDDEHDKAIEEK
jgi:hypothetical protein